METIFLATFDVRQLSVSTTIMDRDCIHQPTCHGSGHTVQDAFSKALANRRLTFKSERDELDACAAAMRGKNFLFRVTGRDQVESLGLT